MSQELQTIQFEAANLGDWDGEQRLSEWLESKLLRLRDMQRVLEALRDDWDCDTDAHKYNTSCRCCLASRVLDGRDPWAYGND